MSTLPRFTVACAAAAALAACGDAQQTQPVAPPGPAAATRFEIISGDDQSATVGTELPQPLVVRALDAAGNPMGGQIINFRVVRGNGSVFAGSAITTSAGIAREWWTVGTVAGDTQRVEARNVDPQTGDKRVYATFEANAVAGASVHVEGLPLKVTVGQVGATLQDTPRVVTYDRYRNLVRMPGIAVTWTPSGNGRVSAARTYTDDQGIARVRWAFSTTAGEQFLTARVPGTGADSAVFAGTAVPRAAAFVQITPDSIPFSAKGQSKPVSIVAADPYGNPVPYKTLASTNNAVAQVYGGGSGAYVQAMGSGRALIIVTAGTHADTAVARVP